MKNNKLYIVLSIIVALALVFCLSFFFFKVFKEKMPPIISNLEVSFSDSGNIVNEDDSNVTDISTVSPYNFRVTNKGVVKTKYNIIISDSISTNTFKREEIRYQLLLNNSVIKTGNLEEIKNNIIDTRSIDGNATNYYSLRVWLKENLEDLDAKIYQYNLKLVPIG